MSAEPSTIWCDGRLVPASAAAVSALDSAYRDGLGCYTTARCERGKPLWPSLHADRLVRDCAALGLGRLEPARARTALADAAAATLGDDPGALRLQCSRVALAGHADEGIRITGVARSLGADAPAWTAIAASVPHWGPMPWGGAKITGHAPAVLGRREARERGVDEALLFDTDGFLLEGARSNLVVRRADGRLVTPDLARGGVRGLARDRLLAGPCAEEISVGDVTRDALERAIALVAVNAVRGARPITRFEELEFPEEPGEALASKLREALGQDGGTSPVRKERR